ncbi:MAG: TonB C-terminal domain-containing protein [Alphaproteobacteria bacterium]
MRKALVASSALHTTLLVLAVVGLPHLRKEIEPEPTIAVSLVEIGPVSQTPEVAPPPPKPEPPKAEVQPVPPPPPAPAPTKAAPPPPEPKQVVAVPPKPEPAPPKPDPVPEKTALPAQPPKPKDKPKQEETAKKPEPKKDQKKDDFADIETFLQNRLKNKPQQPTPQVDPKSKQQVAINAPSDANAKPQTEPVTRTAAVAPLGPSLSGTELDMIRQSIKDKWNANCGLKGFSQMATELAVQVLPDGTVTSVKVERATGSGDSIALTAFVDSAIRAVNQASPLPIPKDKYAQFDRFIVAFTPKEADCM